MNKNDWGLFKKFCNLLGIKPSHQKSLERYERAEIYVDVNYGEMFVDEYGQMISVDGDYYTLDCDRRDTYQLVM